MLGRPAAPDPDAAARPAAVAASRPDPAELAPVDVAFEFSHAASVEANVRYALDTGCRRVVVGTTGWDDARPRVATLLEDAGAAMVAAPTFSPGAVLFGQIAETAARLFGGLADYDPYILEWHRRTKPDRPSGTALALADRVLPHLKSKRRARLADAAGAPDPTTLEVVALRAGASPGLHVFGFDSPGESLELRLAARDRSAYVAGALMGADWLLADGARTGVHEFASILTSILTTAGGQPAEHLEEPRASLH